MKIIETTYSTVSELIEEILTNQEEAFVYAIGTENCAIIGRNGGADIQAIKDKNIRYVEINHEGGTIISSPGDVEIGIFTKGYYGREIIRDGIINDIVKLIKEKGHNVEIDNNDILINNRKVVGFGSRMYGELLYSAIQISVNCNIDLIKSICTKPMKKQPDGLANYGISTEDILQIMKNRIL